MGGNGKRRGQVVLITGVSSGFGRSIALELAGAGHRVYGISRRKLADPPLAAALAGYLPGDLCLPETAERAVDQVLQREGRLDVLINDAGMGIGGALEDTDDEALHHLMELNFFAMARMCRAALPAMRRQGTGTILNISSLGGLVVIDGVRIIWRLLRGVAAFPAMAAVALPEVGWSMLFVFPVYALFLWVFNRVPKRTVL